MDHQSIAKIAANPASVKTEAARMRSALKQLTGWQNRFLQNLELNGVLPSKLWEAFYDLRTRASQKIIVGRYRAYDLTIKVYEARIDLLDEDAEEFLEKMIGFGPELSLTEGQWRYLFALARKLSIIEDEYIQF